MASRAPACRPLLKWLGVLACAMGALGAVPAAALDDPAAAALTGVLARIARAGVVRVGYREDAAPFAFVSRAGVPAGYTVDLCRAVVDGIREAIGERPLAVAFVRVRADERIARIADGDVDLECGATTVTPERAARVAFSPAIFFTGTRLAVPRGARVRSLEDLAGGRVAVVRGSSNVDVVREVATRRRLELRLVEADHLAQAFDLLAAGQVEAVAGDEILLLGELVRAGRRADVALVGPLLSFDRYGIAYARGDPALRDVVDATLRRLAASGELHQAYDKWFVRPLPNGMRLDLPMGEALKRSFEMLGQRLP